MKNKTAGFLLRVLICAVLLPGCSSNEATEAANESEQTENEGKGDVEEVQEEEAPEVTPTAGEEEAEEPVPMIGLLFPAGDPGADWQTDLTEMSRLLGEAGYAAEILYAEDAQTQISQIETLTEEEAEAEALIICPVDPYGLTEVLKETAETSIPVLAYDRLIMNTDEVNYYVTFDTRAIGRQIGESIVQKIGLEKAREDRQSYTIEFFMGSPDDNGSLFLFNGIMEILQEYMDDGTLVCRSGRVTFDDTAVMRWSDNKVETGFQTVISEFYEEEGTPDIVCTARDSFARTVIGLLEKDGMDSQDEDWPLIAGVGAQAESVRSVAEGKQGFTVFMDGRELAKTCAELVTTYLGDETPEVDNYEQYDNGVKIIGTCTCGAQIIDGDNYQILVDNGYYEAEDIAPELRTSVTPQPEEEAEPAETPRSEEEAEPTVTPSPDEEEKSAETPSPEEEKKSVETPSPEEEKKPTGTPRPEEEEKSAETPSPEEEEKPTGTPRPEKEEKSAETPSPEEEKKPTGTPRPENK